MAEANGCPSSGQRGSYAHKALPQKLQKRLLAGPVLSSRSCTLAWKAVMFSSPSSRKEEESAPRLKAYPPPSAVLRQIEQ